MGLGFVALSVAGRYVQDVMGLFSRKKTSTAKRPIVLIAVGDQLRNVMKKIVDPEKNRAEEDLPHTQDKNYEESLLF